MTSQSSEKPLQTLFQQCTDTAWFAKLQTHVKTLQAWQAIFNQECPLELMGQCRVLEFSDQCLLLGVNNASIAAQLQYRTRELMIALRKYPEFAGIKKIKVKICKT